MTTIKKKYYFLIILINICFGTKTYSQHILTASAKKITMHPLFEVFHVNDSVSELHFKINNKELLYTKRDGPDFTANCLVYYNLLPTYNSREILESDSVRFSDINNDNSENFLIGKINVNIVSGKTLFLRVTVVDLNRNTTISETLTLEKINELTRQNFLITPKNSTIPIFRNYLKIKDTVTIHYKKEKSQKVYVNYYNRDFPLALPPFSVTEQPHFDYKPDSLFVVKLSNEGKLNFTPTKKGFYHFQLDTSKRDGLTLFLFSDNFPEIKNAKDMFYPIRFITSKEEFDSIDLSNNLKAEIERFWLTTNHYDKEKTRETIHKFYDRVKNSNRHFTSYVEGWRSDRGMIYLIYGMPNSIYRAEYYETWTYSDATNLNTFSFSFIKVMNPFTNNDYKLDRSPSYKQEWFLTVDAWRQGIINNNDE